MHESCSCHVTYCTLLTSWILHLVIHFVDLAVKMYLSCSLKVGWDGVVGIATRYRPDSSGIISWWGQDFPQMSKLALGPTQSPIQWVPCLSLGVKQLGRGIDHLPPSSAEVKERVELYLYTPSGPVIGWTLPLLYLYRTPWRWPFEGWNMSEWHSVSEFVLIINVLIRRFCMWNV